MEIRGVFIEDTFAEAFGMRAARVVITARTMKWARAAALKLTGFATSVIACKCEAAIERELTAAFRRWRSGEALQLRQDVSRYSRRGLAAQLAAVFDELLTDPAADHGSSASAPPSRRAW